MKALPSIMSSEGFAGAVFSPRGGVLTAEPHTGLIGRMNTGETLAPLIYKGVSTIAVAFASVGVTAAQLETWLKIAALLVGGLIVPVYTMWSMSKANKVKELELQIRADEVRVRVAAVNSSAATAANTTDSSAT